MARPKGYLMSARAWDDVLRLTGASLTEVAERAGIPRATVSGLYGGHHRASVTVAHKLSAAAGCHYETLFPLLSLEIAKAAA